MGKDLWTGRGFVGRQQSPPPTLQTLFSGQPHPRSPSGSPQLQPSTRPPLPTTQPHSPLLDLGMAFDHASVMPVTPSDPLVSSAHLQPTHVPQFRSASCIRDSLVKSL